MNNKYDEELGLCPYCGAKKVRNPKTGKIFCADKCWLKGKDVGGGAKNAPQVNFSTQGAFPSRSEEIREAQKHKESSMRIMSSGRDAVLIVTTHYPELSIEGKTPDGKDRETRIKEMIEYWQNYLYTKIYGDAPFK